MLNLNKSNCGICEGKLITIIKTRKKYIIDNVEYFVPNVKVLKCSKCGEEFITEEVHDYIMDYIEEADNNRIYSLTN